MLRLSLGHQNQLLLALRGTMVEADLQYLTSGRGLVYSDATSQGGTERKTREGAEQKESLRVYCEGQSVQRRTEV